MTTTSEIRLRVDMDDDGIDTIRWDADDGPEPGEQSAKAMILALWDADKRNALRIDLWTKDLSVDDMNDFFFQTLLSMADTYRNATSDANLMAEIKLFARDFAEKAARAAASQGRAHGG
jgi:gliding motility-associated protein GldC